MSLDMSKYLALFTSEATEHLDAMGGELVSLEQQRSPDVLASLFRHAHSVKGMAAAMGFAATATLAHRLEDVLGVLRDAPERIDRPTVDLLLQGVDALSRHARTAAVGTFDDVTAVQEALGERYRLLSGRDGLPTRVANVVAAPAPPPLPGGLARFVVELQVLATSATPGVRAFLAYKRLSTLGDLFAVQPELSDIKAGKLPQGRFRCEVETKASQADIEALVRTIGEVEPLSVRPAASGSAAPSAPPPGPSPEVTVSGPRLPGPA
ncbi:MAG: Hpt domain-containing protein, partial [Myxococcaceae bacterium]|nr:Hpt domain-containing protein [Myxococcaceae bacterium]